MSRFRCIPAGSALLCAILLAAVFCAGAGAGVSQKAGVRVAVKADMTPSALPRAGVAPVNVAVSGRISTVGDTPLPQLRRLEIEINRHGRFDYSGLPVCSLSQIQPANNAKALSACRSSLVGQGSFSAEVVLHGVAPYATKGRLLVFNGREGRRQVLFGHIFTSQPFTNSFVITFRIESIRRGPYGTALVASLPQALGNWGYVTGIEMSLFRRWSAGGQRHSYISAGCPAPKGISGATFPLARADFRFDGGLTLAETMSGTCRAR